MRFLGRAMMGCLLAGTVLVLAAFVLRYMRRTAVAIAAGESRLRHLAMHDPLCGLPNRIFFGERLESVIDEVRAGSSSAAVFYIDLDHFKDVNDTLGHPVGDELIRNVTLRLSHTLRGDDLVARLGGDEFAVISSTGADHNKMMGLAQRLIAAINEQLWVGHFDIWTHTGMIMYRQALVLPGGLTASTAQCESMLVGAIHACERYYPAFQFVVWAGKTSAEAMSAAMFDTEGEA